MRTVFLSALLLISLSQGRMLLDVQGNLEVVPIRPDSNFTLPNSTLLRDENGETHNLLEELNALKQILINVQAQLTVHPPACDWEGTRCHCFFKSSGPLDDILILTGSNCTNGRVGATRVLDAVIATTIAGCSVFNTTGRCDDMIL